jgi:hypothetical protein
MKKYFSQIQKFVTVVLITVVSLLSLSVATPAYAQSSVIPNPCAKTKCLITNLNLQGSSKESIADFILTISVLLTYFIGALAVLAIVIGALFLIIGRADQGWGIIRGAVLGLIVSILAYTVVYVVGQVLQGQLFVG